jgi:lipopolysaccharide transport system permease protein
MHALTIYRQAMALTKANLKARYRSTWTGFLWVILFPVLIYTAQSFAFHFILKINVVNYPLFLLTGLLPWIFFSTSVDMSTGAYLYNGRLLKSFPIHPLSLVFSQIADNFLNYCVAFLILLIPLSYMTHYSMARWLLVIPPFISLFFFVVGFTNFVATLNVFFRDTKFILTFLLQVSYFITPIFYPKELIPVDLTWVLNFNPFYIILRPFQLLSQDFQVSEYLELLGSSFALSILVLVFSAFYWKRKRNELYFHI